MYVYVYVYVYTDMDVRRDSRGFILRHACGLEYCTGMFWYGLTQIKSSWVAGRGGAVAALAPAVWPTLR